ncbi:VWA domain-containing protein [Natribaculum luteum]|uniref:VWA domain-containing protein n=1 Tax=Natribaculum luteum TaxID=1586232 RepID=A0ABD5NUZ1_9EURY|nr:vWA domain-containing protein [Natribaculum luteum]
MARSPNGLSGRFSDDRAFSPQVGLVLLFVMVFAGATLVALTGMSLIDALEGQATREQADQTLQVVDKELSTMIHSGEEETTIAIDSRYAEDYDIRDGGNLSVVVTNRFGDRCSQNTTLGTLQYDGGEDLIGYQAGGRWQRTGDSSTMLSSPDIRYVERTDGENTVYSLDLTLPSVSGEISGGENIARGTSFDDGAELQSCIQDDDFGYPSNVTLEVEDTPFHEAWYDFLREEFDAEGHDKVVYHEPDNRTVRVEAPLGSDRPFADYVDLEPTIYGGLYVEGASTGNTQFDRELAIDRYDSRYDTYEGSDSKNKTSDFFLIDSDDRVKLQGTGNGNGNGPKADIEGWLVVNDELQVLPGANVTPPLAFADVEKEPSGTPGSSDVHVNEGNVTFDSIAPINDEIEQAHEYLENESAPGTGTVKNGMYYKDGLYKLDGGTINTSDGDVHVAVDGDLNLTDVTVTGDGQAHFYVDEDIDVKDVEVPNDRASALWIYGTDSTGGSVGGEFGGVVYAPGSDDLEIDDGTEVYGAIVGGKYDKIGDGVDVHFDESLRTDIPIEEDIEFKIGGGTRDPIDVTFVLDRSGSMDWNDPDGIRVDATKDFIGLLDNSEYGDKAGVFEFNTGGNQLHELSGDLTSVNQSVVAREDGGTDMSAGMELALDEYDDGDDPDRDRTMILLSDGENDCGWFCDSDELDEQTMDLAQNDANDKNVTIYTVGLGDHVDEDLLEDVADATGGEYHHADNAEELEDIFAEDIGNAIVEDPPEPKVVSVKADGAGDNYAIRVVEQEIEFD